MNSFAGHWQNGNYAAAAESTGGSAQGMTADRLAGLELFDLLHFAEATRLSGNDRLAIDAYDHTEEAFRRFDEETLAGTAARQVSAVLVNETVTRYRGFLYEAVLANTYKGLSFLALAEPDMARVEFRRADDRTRRAVEYFADSLAAEQQALAQDQRGRAQAQAVNASLASNSTRQVIGAQYGDPRQWAAYPNFTNPFVTYLHGLFFMASAQAPGDLDRARQSLSRVAGMTRNPVVTADLELVDQLSRGGTKRRSVSNLVWVVYENGLSPHFIEQRIDLPLAVLTGGRTGTPYYAGIALPKLVGGRPAGDGLTVSGAAGSQTRTLPLSEMQRVMNTEFKARFDGILFRSLTSAVLKMAMQSAASEEFGVLGGVVTAVASAATTQADVRSWRALPYTWELARVSRPANGQIRLRGPLGDLTVSVPDWPMTLVYIKQPTAAAQPSIRIIDLSGRHRGIDPFTVPRVAQVQP